MPRKNVYVNTGGRSSDSVQKYTWGYPENEAFNQDAANSITNNPYAHPVFITWTLGVGEDLATGTNLTPYFRIPTAGVLSNVRAVSKTAVNGTTSFDINHAASPDVAGSSIFTSTVCVISSGQYESSVNNDLRINTVAEDDILSIDCDATPTSTRNITVVLEMLVE